MKERPILFSGPMVRALLAGTKTQTRRVVKRTALEWLEDDGFTPAFVAEPGNGLCPYGRPGDQLWVREAWRLHERFSDVARIVYSASKNQSWTEAHEDYPVHLAGTMPPSVGFKPSIHMPRWASRLTLQITDVRVERLQDISEADAEAEGTQEPSLVPLIGAFWSSRDGYAKLWEHINGKGSWDANPWVWAVSFEVQEPKQ